MKKSTMQSNVTPTMYIIEIDSEAIDLDSICLVCSPFYLFIFLAKIFLFATIFHNSYCKKMRKCKSALNKLMHSDHEKMIWFHFMYKRISVLR